MSYTRLRARQSGTCFYSVLFAREHASRVGDSSLPAGRTLFVANVPCGTTEPKLKAAFKKLGDISSVSIGQGESGAEGHTAHVVFERPAALKKALATTKTLLFGAADNADSSLRAVEEGREELQQSVDAFMRKFEQDEARRREAEESAHNQMDADGWHAPPPP